ncbi:MAG: Ubiquinone biosynthesis O-methyltransferase, mitochondrial [Chlamydiia bacterium]|nr:Ubiquinone biosynthesis O-methyltransferase, mitochondrial [Chlamydiia bacterium]MCH9624553.1 Ubiquinone biosynthesis O-methyltransferase, mitochondrial [Chlamydiia bacterium]
MEKVSPAVAAVSAHQFWKEVEATPPLDSASASLTRRVATSFSIVEPYAQAYFKNPPEKILDLGAGSGINSIPMAENGGHVTAIDLSKYQLNLMRNNYVRRQLPDKNREPVHEDTTKITESEKKGSIESIYGDITQIAKYGEEFDLVLAVDILSFLPPSTLKSTMQKISSCLKKGGYFIGTIHTDNSLEPRMINLMKKIGIHLYSGAEFVEQLLTVSGFTMIKIEERVIELGGGFRFEAKKSKESTDR